MTTPFLLFASLNGFLAVALGAFAAHGLESRLTPDALATFQTGVQYHMAHSLALLAVGVLARTVPPAALLQATGYLFLCGIALFSGSLYALSLSGIGWLGAITPFGGLAFLAGWGCLFRLALTLDQNR